MKKVLAVLIAATMLTGCGSKPENVSKNEQESTSDENITLNLYGTASFVEVGEKGTTDLTTGVEKPGYEVIVNRWEELHPNVKLNIQTCPWDNWMSSIQTAVLSEDVDVILHGASLSELVEPLNSYLEADPEFAESIFVTENKRADVFGPLDQVTVAGLQYVIEPAMAYLDKDIFEHYGVDIPDASWTWDELLETAEKLTGTDPVTGEKTYGVQLTKTQEQNIMINYYVIANAFDARPITYGASAVESTIDNTNDKMIRTFQMISDLAECCAPNVREGVNVVDDLTADNNAAIRWGTLAYDKYSKLEAVGIEDRFAFVPLPVVEEGEAAGSQSTFFGSFNMAICNTSKNKDWAWEFLKFMCTDEVAVQWTIDGGGMPNAKIGQQMIKEKMGEQADAYFEVLESVPESFCNSTNENYDNVNFGTWSTTLVTELKDLVYGSTTPQEAAQSLQDATDEYMESIQ